MSSGLLLCGVLGDDPQLRCLLCGCDEFRELELIGYEPPDPWSFRDELLPDGSRLFVPYPLSRSCYGTPSAAGKAEIVRLLHEAAAERRAERRERRGAR